MSLGTEQIAMRIGQEDVNEESCYRSQSAVCLKATFYRHPQGCESFDEANSEDLHVHSRAEKGSVSEECKCRLKRKKPECDRKHVFWVPRHVKNLPLTMPE